MSAPLLCIKGATKTFGHVRAVDDVSFEVHSGEALCVLGENGAGKTTLMNMLYGLYRPDAGRMLWRSEEIRITSPRQALELGIGMIHQRFMLVPTLTVTENILLSLQDTPRILRQEKTAARISELAEKYDLQVDADALVSDLSLGERQRVEILKNIAHDADLLILDEPTSVLSPQEVDGLWATLAILRDAGLTLMPITHKLPEVRAIADRVMVLRDGQVVGTWNNDAVSDGDLIKAIVRTSGGSDEGLESAAAEQIGGVAEALEIREEIVVEAPAPARREPVIRLEEVKTRGSFVNLAGVSLEVVRGELVGIAGVDGNGQTALARLLAGLERPSSGEVTRFADENSIGFVPADRIGMSLVGNFTLTENTLLRQIGNPEWKVGKLPLIAWPRVRNRTQNLIDKFEIKGHSSQEARELSGGNQQKVVMARETYSEPDFLVIEQPTQGLDIGATAAVVARVRELAGRGAGVVWISSNLDELIAECDRILVLYKGNVAGEVAPGPEATSQAGRLMLGGAELDDNKESGDLGV